MPNGNDSILTNIENIIVEDEISKSDIDGIDQRIIRHLVNCAKNEFKKLFASTGHTDLLILLMSVLPNVLENFQFELICQFGICNNLKYYKVNDLCSSLTNDVCIAFLFLCFYGVWHNVKFLQTRSTQVFWCLDERRRSKFIQRMCNEPLRITDNDLNILEKFVLSLYYPEQSSFKSINHERMSAF